MCTEVFTGIISPVMICCMFKKDTLNVVHCRSLYVVVRLLETSGGHYAIHLTLGQVKAAWWLSG